MVTKASYIVNDVSVVLVTESISPVMLNPDFLTAKKIVPKSWKVTETVSLPVMSNVAFQNRTSFRMEPNRISVEDGTDIPDGGFKDSYKIHTLAEKLLKKIPEIKVRDVGLNCRLIWKKDNAEEWLADRFLKKGRWGNQTPKLTSSLFRFKFEGAGGLSLIIELSAASFVHNISKEKIHGINMLCNFHHAGPMLNDKVFAILQTWSAKEKQLIRKINQISSGK